MRRKPSGAGAAAGAEAAASAAPAVLQWVRREGLPHVADGKRMRYAGDGELPPLSPPRGFPAAVEDLHRAGAGGGPFADVVRGLLLLGAGGVDECHNAVTPYSWDGQTGFAGAPVPGTAAEGVATYAHALVHRSEGAQDGEFGSGYNNSNYWFRRAQRHAKVCAAVGAAAAAAAAGAAAPGPAAAFAEQARGGKWDPVKFNAVCSRAEQGGDAAARKWCAVVAAAEWAALVDETIAQWQAADGAKHRKH